MPNGSSLAAGAPQPSLSLFGTVGVPITIAAAVAVVLIGILAVRSRQKKKARAAAAARLAAAQTVQVSMAELREESKSARPSSEPAPRRTPPATETRKVSPARRFAEPRSEPRRDHAWPSTGEWRAVAEPAANGTNGDSDPDSGRIAARLGGPPGRNGAVRTNGTPAERTRVTGAAPTRTNGAPAERNNGATRANGVPAERNGAAARANGVPAERNGATPTNGAPAERNGAIRTNGVPAERNGAASRGVPAERNGAVPRTNGAPADHPARVNGTSVNGTSATRINGPARTSGTDAQQRNGAPAQRAVERPLRPSQRLPRQATVPQRGPQPVNEGENRQEPGWPAEPDWPTP